VLGLPAKDSEAARIKKRKKELPFILECFNLFIIVNIEKMDL
jgi:hypothetical protein